MAKGVANLRDQLAAIVNGMGYEFVGVELQGSVLRLYIDKEQGINVEDCSRISRQVSALLDVEDPIQGRYSLEVSSPGLDRPLFELAQYGKQIGKRLKVQMQVPIDNRRKFVGVLKEIKESDIHLIVDEKEIVLPFSDIEKANVIAEIR